MLFSVWKNICPPKVEVFAWMALQNCIASRSVLSNRGILNINSVLCPFCFSEAETPDHLLLLCNIAWGVWSAIISWWKMVWAILPTLISLFQFWNGFRFKNLERLCWQATFYAVIWSIWTCRNETIFNNKKWELEEILDLSKSRMAIWIKGKYNVKDYSVEDFKRCLEGIRKVKI